MEDDIRRTVDSSQIPTRELQRQERKLAYEAGKVRQKAARAKAKADAAEARQQERAQRDAELWQALRPATALEESQDT